MLKICEGCGKEFKPKTQKQRACKKSCVRRKPFTEDHRKHLSESRLGMKFSQSHCENIRKSVLNRTRPPREPLVPKCKCGETDATKFYPYNPWSCKKCLYSRQKKKLESNPNTEKRHQYYLNIKANSPEKIAEQARRSRQKWKDKFNAIQRERRRCEEYKLRDRLNNEARRMYGSSYTKLTESEIRGMFVVRLYKLKESSAVTQEDVSALMVRYKENPKSALLSLYKYRTIPNVLWRKGISNQYGGKL